MYERLKYIHILAAIVWFGGAFFVQLLALKASRPDDPTELPRVGRDIGLIGGRVFPLASIILLIAGVLLVLQRLELQPGLDRDRPGAVVASLLSGVLFPRPAPRRRASSSPRKDRRPSLVAR